MTLGFHFMLTVLTLLAMLALILDVEGKQKLKWETLRFFIVLFLSFSALLGKHACIYPEIKVSNDRAGKAGCLVPIGLCAAAQ